MAWLQEVVSRVILEADAVFKQYTVHYDQLSEDFAAGSKCKLKSKDACIMARSYHNWYGLIRLVNEPESKDESLVSEVRAWGTQGGDRV